MAVSTAPAAEVAAPAELPRWDLEGIFGYESPMSASIDAELDAIEVACKALKGNFEGNLGEQLLVGGVV